MIRPGKYYYWGVFILFFCFFPVLLLGQSFNYTIDGESFSGSVSVGYFSITESKNLGNLNFELKDLDAGKEYQISVGLKKTSLASDHILDKAEFKGVTGGGLSNLAGNNTSRSFVFRLNLAKGASGRIKLAIKVKTPDGKTGEGELSLPYRLIEEEKPEITETPPRITEPQNENPDPVETRPQTPSANQTPRSNPTRNTPPKEEPKTLIEKEWTKIEEDRGKSVRLVVDFVNKFRKDRKYRDDYEKIFLPRLKRWASEHVNPADISLEISYEKGVSKLNIPDAPNRDTYGFVYPIKLEVEEKDEKNKLDFEAVHAKAGTILIKNSDETPYRISITDELGIIKMVSFHTPMHVEGATESGDFFSIRIKDGRPPYHVELISEAGDEPEVTARLLNLKPSAQEGTTDIITFSRDTLGEIAPGKYKFLISDARALGRQPTPQVFTFGEDAESGLSLAKLPPWIIGVIALSVLLLIVLIVNSSRKRKIHEEIAEKDIRKSNATISSREGITISKTKAAEKADVGFESRKKPRAELSPVKFVELAEENKGKGNDPEWIQKVLDSDDYVRFDLETIWTDTSVSEIYISKNCTEALTQFIADQNLKSFSEENSEGIPEIGGFILGRYAYNEVRNAYILALEKFAPVQAEQQGVYSVEFGVAWAGNQLADVQDQYQELETIAWFHTHPGHGLFLSLADLNIHQGFFQKRYHVAMEIDPLSPGQDTAFFTRTKKGDVNNSRDMIVGAGWFKWDELQHNPSIN